MFALCVPAAAACAWRPCLRGWVNSNGPFPSLPAARSSRAGKRALHLQYHWCACQPSCKAYNRKGCERPGGDGVACHPLLHRLPVRNPPASPTHIVDNIILTL